MTINLLSGKENCCGCGACTLSCPTHAITMRQDACGFLYPVIDAQACIDCGTCLKKCAFQSGYPERREFDPFLAFGARHKNEDAVAHSRSGAAFIALSDRVLERGGVVYGCRFKQGSGFRRIVHDAAQSATERDAFCGSKYAQSDLGTTFARAEEDLKAGRTVLFTGTGCQIGALHVYLGREYDNLFTVDIVCFGATSQKLWSDYLDWVAAKNGKVVSADFRDKGRFGWRTHKETVVTKRGRYSARIFASLFQSGLVRPSCLACRYSNTNRPGDLTLADFWGHEKALGELWDDDKGISLVLVNNAHGKVLWDDAERDLDTVECTGYPFRHQSMKHPVKKWDSYDEFWADYIERGFGYCVQAYVDQKTLASAKMVQKKSLARKVARRLRKIIK